MPDHNEELREVLRWIIRLPRDSPEWIDGVRRVAHNALHGMTLAESFPEKDTKDDDELEYRHGT